MSTHLSTLDAVVSRAVLVKSPTTTSTGLEVTPEVTSFARAISFDVVDSRPRAADRVGFAIYSFARRLRRLGEVKAVAYATEGHVHLVWTFIHERRKELRQRIYEEERHLMARFPDLVFDFNVSSLDRLATRSLLPDDIQGQLIYYHGEL